MIAAGGTAGHVVPALAVADALRAAGREVTFIGGTRAEAQLVRAAASAAPIAVAGLEPREPVACRACAGARGEGCLAPGRCSARSEPDAVMGGGGYLSGPVGLAAVTLRMPLVLTEADSQLGLTDRTLAPFARRVCLAFPPPPPPRPAATADATASPVARSRRGRKTAPARGRGWGSSRARPACWCSAARWGRARSTSPRSRRTRAPLPRAARLRAARPPGAGGVAALPPGYDLREYLDLAEFAQALAPPTWSWPAQGARCSRSPPTAARRS